MIFQLFAKENCPTCQKAQAVLRRLGVTPQVRYVDGPQATPDNVAEFAWHDWVDKMPLVIVTDDAAGDVVQRWDGNSVAGRWFPVVQEWLAGHPATAGAESS
ncbi:MAG: glutaredoxin domain-containing protein [bacterium]